MTSNRFTVERFDVTTHRTFEDAAALLESSIPTADADQLAQLVASRAGPAAVEGVVNRMVGDLGLMVLAKVDQGALVSLLGPPKKIRVYLIGNPLLANRMFERDRGVGLYAPIRVSLYEDGAGAVHLAYDQPSTLLAQFDDAEIRAVATTLDDKMAILSRRLVHVPPA